jgi:tRNA dimethylallyltransferase
MQGVPHHMLAVAPPDASYSVAEYVHDTLPVIDGIISRGNIPALVGGTGLYLEGIRKKQSYGSAIGNPELREELERLTNDELHLMLCELDEDAASRVHAANRKRVIRYIEIIKISGKSPLQDDSELRYDILPIGIAVPKDILDERIKARVHNMISAGLVDEVRSLLNSGVSPKAQSMQAIGYKEIIGYLDGNCTLDEAVERIVIGTRQYAKRQMTWFRRTAGIAWFDADDTIGIIDAARKFLFS